MEGHELPEWSGGGYYGEEVRARGAAAPVPTARDTCTTATCHGRSHLPRTVGISVLTGELCDRCLFIIFLFISQTN